MMWLAGKFSPKVPATFESRDSVDDEVTGPTVAVRRIRIPRIESSVGTIRAVHETTIGSKLLARVVEVDLKAGKKVRAGDVLVRLDDTDLQAKLKQSRAAVTAAEATHAQALRDEARYAALLKTNAASRQDYERTATAVRSSEAELVRAKEVENEVQATLEWATVRAPMDGTVIDKKVDVGDLVTPGQALVSLFDPKRMQLVASVRESLAHRLEVGQNIDVTIEGLNKECTGTISEIVPEAQASSRAFQVKVTGPCPAGVYSGMFGRVLIPLDLEQLLVIPQRAVHNVGQLELVDVINDHRKARRAVRTGRTFGEDVEILSGLREGERVLVAAGSAAVLGPSHD
jgi:RND family efflux transporter MFP subunit